MKPSRLLAPLALALLLVFARSAFGQAFVRTGSMLAPRYGHAAVALANGRVLVAAGSASAPVLTAEIYDPATGLWTATGKSLATRVYPAAVRLADGRVLLTGGYVNAQTSATQQSAELYDPATGQWATTNPPASGEGGTLTLLASGQVLRVGGTATGELYDPATGMWTATGALVVSRRQNHRAVLLPGGKVLINGGIFNGTYLTSCELYDPVLGTFTATGSLPTAMSGTVAALLPNGEYLLAGGLDYSGGSSTRLAKVEIYNVTSGAWRAAADLPSRRGYAAGVVLADGMVLLTGGVGPVNNIGIFLPRTEFYDPAANTWADGASLAYPRDLHTATRLADGEVLVGGGVGEGGSYPASAELYDPTAPRLAAVTIASNHPGIPALGDPGDVVTVSFTSTQAITAPTVTLLGQAVTATAGAGNSWTAAASVLASTPDGAATFAITYPNSAGRLVAPVTVTTDASAVAIDTVTQPPTTTTGNQVVGTSLALTFNLPETPLAGSVKLIFRNYNNGSIASTLTLAAAQEVAGQRTLTFNPGNPTANPQISNGAAVPDAEYTLLISYQDAAGNAAATTMVPYIRVDTVAPVISAATMYPLFARTGTVVSVSVAANESLGSVSGTIAGLTATSVLYPSTQAQVTITNAVPEGPVSFSVKVADQAGNVSAPFTMTASGSSTVVDHTPPVLTVPGNLTVEATSASGAVVTFTPTATDTLDPAPFVSSSPSSRSTFHLGPATKVQVTARDAAQNTTSGSFTVKVVDTTKPTASVPAALSVAAGPNGRAALGDLRAQVTCSDAVGVTSVVQTPDATTVHSLGSYPVSFAVSDAAGNTTTVQTTVTVAFDPPSVLAAVTPGAHSGQAAPAGPPAGTVLSTFGPPAISDFRDRATVVGMLDGRSKLAGILVEDALDVARLAAFQGGPVPGITTAGVTFKSFLDPVISPGGAVAFAGTVQGGGVKTNADQGVWTDAFGGSLGLALREGSEVPGLGGATLKAVTSLSLRDGELLALVTLMPASNLVTTADDTALVSLSSTTTGQLLHREGKPLGGEAGTRVKSFSVLQPALGSAGQGRWRGDGVVVAKVTLASGEMRVVKIAPATGAVTKLLSTADAATPVDATAHWKSFGLPAVEPTGAKFAVAATLLPLAGVMTVQNDTVLLSNRSGGTFTPFAREGAAISAAGDAPRYASFFDPVINDAGRVAFLATLQGSGVTAANKTALFAGAPGSQQPVARLGGEAPDARGTAIPGVKWSKFLSCALASGDRGGVILLAEVSGPGVTVKNKLRLYAQDSTGQLVEVLTTGAALVTAGPTLTTFTLLAAAPGAFGTARSYNATGSVAVLATLADQTQTLLRIDVP